MNQVTLNRFEENLNFFMISFKHKTYHSTMLYLYTIMMFAWDLDKDTHSYFREYLTNFINKRKISKDLREFVLNTRSRAIASHIRPVIDLPKQNFNELRISLSGRVFIKDKKIKVYYTVLNQLQNRTSAPNLIEKIHPPKYHHNARKLSTPSRPHTNP